MGDDDNGDDKGDICLQLAVATFIVFMVLDHLYAGAAFYGVLFFTVALISVLLMFKGFAEYFLKGELTSFWTGFAISLVLVLFFNGLPVIFHAFNVIFEFFNSIFSVAAAL